jgi:hypothetical protein
MNIGHHSTRSFSRASNNIKASNPYANLLSSQQPPLQEPASSNASDIAGSNSMPISAGNIKLHDNLNHSYSQPSQREQREQRPLQVLQTHSTFQNSNSSAFASSSADFVTPSYKMNANLNYLSLSSQYNFIRTQFSTDNHNHSCNNNNNNKGNNYVPPSNSTFASVAVNRKSMQASAPSLTNVNYINDGVNADANKALPVAIRRPHQM